MIRPFGIVVALLLASAPARAADVFDAIKCGGDIPGALVGRSVPNTPIGRLEARHKNIGLEVVGSFGLTDDVAITSFRICGTEYATLNGKRIRDAVALPERSWTAPDLIGTCVKDGRTLPDMVLAILDNPKALRKTRTPQDQQTFLPAKVAWQIDMARGRFVKLDVDGLACPLGDVMDQQPG